MVFMITINTSREPDLMSFPEVFEFNSHGLIFIFLSVLFSLKRFSKITNRIQTAFLICPE